MKPIQQNQPISDLEDMRLKQKCKDLKSKIQSIEKSNEIKSILLSRSKYLIKRLRFEYILLLEMLEKKTLLNSSILNSNQLTSLLDDSFEFNEENLDLNDLNLLLSNSPLVNLKSNDFTLTNLVNVVLQNKSKPIAPATSTSTSATKETISPDVGNPYAELDESFINSNFVKRKRGGPGALKKARAKDPSIPKRPTNAYLIFCDLQKEKLKKEIEENRTTNRNNNNIDTETSLNTDLSKAMTEAWKELNDEERKPYYELYEQDRLRYHREIEVYSQKLKKEKEVEDGVAEPVETAESTPVPEDEDEEDDEDAEKSVKKIKLESSLDNEPVAATDDVTAATSETKEPSSIVEEEVEESKENTLEPVESVEPVEPVDPVEGPADAVKEE